MATSAATLISMATISRHHDLKMDPVDLAASFGEILGILTETVGVSLDAPSVKSGSLAVEVFGISPL